jgi:hypothetical protein
MDDSAHVLELLIVACSNDKSNIYAEDPACGRRSDENLREPKK